MAWRVTWETVTDESAENGDADARGFITPDGDRVTLESVLLEPDQAAYDMPLRDALAVLAGSAGDLESLEPSDSRWRAARWITAHFNTRNADAGDVIGESFSLHLPDTLTDASRARLCRLLCKPTKGENMKPKNEKPLFVHIADAVTARANCIAREARGESPTPSPWSDIWSERLEQAARDLLPSGSGFDAGTKIDLDASRADRVTLKTAFHHMDAHGGYDGWTTHKIHLTPVFGGYAMRVTGKDRNGIKDYIADAVGEALDARVGYRPGDTLDPSSARLVRVEMPAGEAIQ